MESCLSSCHLSRYLLSSSHLDSVVSSPTQVHHGPLLRVVRYVLGTISHRLLFPCSSLLQLLAYLDATRASDPSDRRSLSAYFVFVDDSLIAYFVFFGDSLIAWKIQSAFSSLSAEA